ncbi:MAG: hypothetical protein QOE36_2364 [Gaiellaceae bacterium]|jgi:hypothetical protein|nr:hypothetical protein [Gaiellaceae bacterium]
MPIAIHEMSATALRPGVRSPRAHAISTVETLVDEIAALIVARQALRSRGAAHSTLERNRRKLVRAQSELSYALIARYLPQS